MIYLTVAAYAFSYFTYRSNLMLTTLYAINLDASTFEIGIMSGLVAFFPMILGVYAGRISDRVGYRLPYIFGSFGLCVALLLPYLIRDQLFILYVSQMIYGLAFVFLLVNMQNLVGGLSTPETRPKNYAIYSMGVSSSNLFGPLVTGFTIDHFGFNNAYLVLAASAAITGLSIVSGLIKLPPPTPKEQRPAQSNIKELLISKELRMVYISSGIVLIGVGIFDFYFPIYGERIGLSASIIGTLFSINAAAFFLVRFAMPWLVNKFNEERVLIACLLVAGLAFTMMPLFGGAITLGIAAFVLGIGLGCGQPISMVMAYSASPPGRTGEVLGVRLTVNKAVQFLVPVIFGSVGTLAGAFPIFWSNALMMFTGGIYMTRNRKDKIG